ncbi:hypothetical protein [Corynebacterium pseudodiphtheriticum]|uniref:hypothetical protein n=1 Tax=Corynebacterium pseudodiphtheriticum TaxID=37637 RepID=UPI00253F65C4|nr:hypothetical protein [Corynebacterium pseudodiphtheriticum]MDK4321708.1 hypothetical protein [Corynebacterium pseudodiphtheriticum]
MTGSAPILRTTCHYPGHTRGRCVYGYNDDKATPERWLNEVRPETTVGSHDVHDAIGVFIDTRHNGGGVVTVDNRNGRSDTPSMTGFDD